MAGPKVPAPKWVRVQRKIGIFIGFEVGVSISIAIVSLPSSLDRGTISLG